jgi:hypothetical protein
VRRTQRGAKKSIFVWQRQWWENSGGNVNFVVLCETTEIAGNLTKNVNREYGKSCSISTISSMNKYNTQHLCGLSLQISTILSNIKTLKECYFM